MQTNGTNRDLENDKMTQIERTLVGWFEASRYRVEHDGHEWFAWVGERMLPLTEIAATIGMELNQQIKPTERT